MIGTGRASSAITITNALSTGIGCAAGIGLHLEARVALTADGTGATPTLEVADDVRTPVVEASLYLGLARYFPEPHAVARLSVRSEIPFARGLKSSSAVSTAVLLAVANATGRSPSSLEVGILSAEASRRAGVSATGALDDALAGLEPGFVVTDNSREELLRRTPVEPDWGVVLYIPPESHPPSPNLRAAFLGERPAGELSVRAALLGDWSTAMRFNTELVERTMGYSYGEVRERLHRHGALASGVSGLGPTLATIAPVELLPEMLERLPADSAQKLIVPFTRSTPEGGAAS